MFSKRWFATHIITMILAVIAISAITIYNVPSLKTAFNHFVSTISPKADEVSNYIKVGSRCETVAKPEDINTHLTGNVDTDKFNPILSFEITPEGIKVGENSEVRLLTRKNASIKSINAVRFINAGNIFGIENTDEKSSPWYSKDTIPPHDTYFDPYEYPKDGEIMSPEAGDYWLRYEDKINGTSRLYTDYEVNQYNLSHPNSPKQRYDILNMGLTPIINKYITWKNYDDSSLAQSEFISKITSAPTNNKDDSARLDWKPIEYKVNATILDENGAESESTIYGKTSYFAYLDKIDIESVFPQKAIVNNGLIYGNKIYLLVKSGPENINLFNVRGSVYFGDNLKNHDLLYSSENSEAYLNDIAKMNEDASLQKQTLQSIVGLNEESSIGTWQAFVVDIPSGYEGKARILVETNPSGTLECSPNPPKYFDLPIGKTEIKVESQKEDEPKDIESVSSPSGIPYATTFSPAEAFKGKQVSIKTDKGSLIQIQDMPDSSTQNVTIAEDGKIIFSVKSNIPIKDTVYIELNGIKQVSKNMDFVSSLNIPEFYTSSDILAKTINSIIISRNNSSGKIPGVSRALAAASRPPLPPKEEPKLKRFVDLSTEEFSHILQKQPDIGKISIPINLESIYSDDDTSLNYSNIVAGFKIIAINENDGKQREIAKKEAFINRLEKGKNDIIRQVSINVENKNEESQNDWTFEKENNSIIYDLKNTDLDKQTISIKFSPVGSEEEQIIIHDENSKLDRNEIVKIIPYISRDKISSDDVNYLEGETIEFKFKKDPLDLSLNLKCVNFSPIGEGIDDEGEPLKSANPPISLNSSKIENNIFSNSIKKLISLKSQLLKPIVNTISPTNARAGDEQIETTCDIDFKKGDLKLLPDSTGEFSYKITNQSNNDFVGLRVGLDIQTDPAMFISSEETGRSEDFKPSYFPLISEDKLSISWNELNLKPSEFVEFNVKVKIAENLDKKEKDLVIKPHYQYDDYTVEKEPLTFPVYELANLPQIKVLGVGRGLNNLGGNSSKTIIYTNSENKEKLNSLIYESEKNSPQTWKDYNYQIVEDNKQFEITFPEDSLFYELTYTNATGTNQKELDLGVQTTKYITDGGFAGLLVQKDGKTYNNFSTYYKTVENSKSYYWSFIGNSLLDGTVFDSTVIKPNESVDIFYKITLNSHIPFERKQVSGRAIVRDQRYKWVKANEFSSRDLYTRITGSIDINEGLTQTIKKLPRVLVVPITKNKNSDNTTNDIAVPSLDSNTIQNYYTNDYGDFDIVLNRQKDFYYASETKLEIVLNSKYNTSASSYKNEWNKDHSMLLFNAADQGVAMFAPNGETIDLTHPAKDYQNIYFKTEAFKLPDFANNDINLFQFTTNDGSINININGEETNIKWEYPSSDNSKSYLKKLTLGAIPIYYNLFNARRQVSTSKTINPEMIDDPIILEDFWQTLVNLNPPGSSSGYYLNGFINLGSNAWDHNDLIRGSQVEFHEFGHWLQDQTIGLKDTNFSSANLPNDKIPYKSVNETGQGFINDKSTASLEDGFATFMQVWLDRKINNRDDWKVTNVDGKTIADLNVLYPATPFTKTSNFANEKANLSSGNIYSIYLEQFAFSEILKEIISTGREQISESKYPWIGAGLGENYLPKVSPMIGNAKGEKVVDEKYNFMVMMSAWSNDALEEPIGKNTIGDFYNRFLQKLVYSSGSATLEKEINNLFIAHGFFHDTNANGKYEPGEDVGFWAQDNGFTYNFALPETKQSKINFSPDSQKYPLSLSKVSTGISFDETIKPKVDSFLTYISSFGSPSKKSVGSRYWRNLTPDIPGSYIKYEFKDKNDQVIDNAKIKISYFFDTQYSSYNSEDDHQIKNKSSAYTLLPLGIYHTDAIITAEGSSDYIFICSEDFWNAVGSSSYNYLLSKTFTIDGNAAPDPQKIWQSKQISETVDSNSSQSQSIVIHTSNLAGESTKKAEGGEKIIANISNIDSRATSLTLDMPKSEDVVIPIIPGAGTVGINLDIPENISLGNNEIKVTTNNGQQAEVRVKITQNKWFNKNNYLILLLILFISWLMYYIIKTFHKYIDLIHKPIFELSFAGHGTSHKEPKHESSKHQKHHHISKIIFILLIPTMLLTPLLVIKAFDYSGTPKYNSEELSSLDSSMENKKDFIRLPKSPNYKLDSSTNPELQWADPIAIVFIERLASKWADYEGIDLETNPLNPLTIGILSKPNGEKLDDVEQNFHQNGMSIDVYDNKKYTVIDNKKNFDLEKAKKFAELISVTADEINNENTNKPINLSVYFTFPDKKDFPGFDSETFNKLGVANMSLHEKYWHIELSTSQPAEKIIDYDYTDVSSSRLGLPSKPHSNTATIAYSVFRANDVSLGEEIANYASKSEGLANADINNPVYFNANLMPFNGKNKSGPDGPQCKGPVNIVLNAAAINNGLINNFPDNIKNTILNSGRSGLSGIGFNAFYNNPYILPSINSSASEPSLQYFTEIKDRPQLKRGDIIHFSPMSPYGGDTGHWGIAI